jgi:hypothetical protein
MTAQQTLYQTDFYAWCMDQAKFLQNKEYEKIDFTQISWEMVAVGNKEKDYLENNLIILFQHLLKHKYQRDSYIFEYQRRGWERSIAEHRNRIKKIKKNNPSLKSYEEEAFAASYESAVYEAYKETGLPFGTLPEVMPWKLEDVLKEDWLPG